MDIYDLFGKFELEGLSKEWVQNLWKDDFSEFVEFPTEYEMFLENTDVCELMSTASSFIKDWLDTTDSFNKSFSSANRPSTSTSLHNRSSLNTSQVDSRSWQNLISNNVQHKALVSVLSMFILRGKTEKDFQTKRLGLVATDLYLMLLAIPGSQVFHIFNPVLYSNAVETLKVCCFLNSAGNSKPAPKKRKGRHDDENLDEDEGHDSDDEGSLLPAEKIMVIKLLKSVLNALSFTLKRFQLKDKDDSLLLTIQILILITRVERNSSSLFSKSPPHNTPSNLAFKAYKVLLGLCSADHGDVKEIVRFIMREIMSALLVFDQKGTKLKPTEAIVVKDHSMKFIKILCESLGDPAFSGVYTLLQHVCVRIPDKADLRAKGVQIVLEILHVMPYALYAHSVVWIMGLCHNDQVKNRVTGLEIVAKLLYESDRTPSSPMKSLDLKSTSGMKNGHTSDSESENEAEDNGVVLTQQPDFSSKKYLLGTLFSRCLDVSSSVRAKALAILANLISSNNNRIHQEMESIFVTPYLNAGSTETRNGYEKEFFDFQKFLKNLKNETNCNVDPLPGGKAVMNLLELFIADEKVFVRKSALQVLSNIFLMNEKWMNNKLLQVLVDNCRDMSVSVRKLLVQCLTDLLKHYPSHPELPKYWVMGVLPLLADQEIKSQEKVLEVLQSIVLNNLVAYNQMKTALHTLPWTVLGLIAECNKRKLFLYACHKWTLTNSLRQSLIAVITTHIGTENNIAAWFLLTSFSEYLDIKEPDFVLNYFYSNVLNEQQVDEYCCQLVTEFVHLSWRQLLPLAQIQLCDNLLRHLSQFTIPLPMISRCLDICQLITESHAESQENARERVKEWAGNLLSICESRLEKVIGVDSPEVLDDEERLSQYIFTVGDTAQICPAQLKHSVLLLIQNLLMGEQDPDEEEELGEEKRWKGTVSASVQAVAVVTLGKLCLQREHTAKVLVPLFGTLLSETPHPEIKINAMIALTDMCIKFTSMVENQLPEMCICLRDKDLRVRENTLTLMIQLIQEDYLKLRCPVFFHLMVTLVDEDLVIRDMMGSFVINSLLVKQKNILWQHFVESLFHYNAYMDHETYSKGSQMMSAREKVVFSLAGPERLDQRRQIYKFMLDNMMDDQLFKITHRLCTDILAGVADGMIELSRSGTTLLQDALYVLSSQEIRLSHLRPGSKDAEEEDEAAGEGIAKVAEAINNLARKTLVTQVVKKNVIENIVPIFIKLKHKLKQLKSPLVRDLMACLRELMKDYKAEINEILAADKELAAEILHDLQNLDQEEEEEEGGISNEEVLKKAVMDVVALSEARKSLNTSNQQPRVLLHRVSTSSRGSVASEKSPSSNKSFRRLQSNSSSPDNTDNKASPCPNSRTLPNSSNKTSPGSVSGSNTSSPGNGNNMSSPGSNKSSPGNKDPMHNCTPPTDILNGDQTSSSCSSAMSDNSCIGSETHEFKNPMRKRSKNPTSISSKNNGGSIISKDEKVSRRNKKKR